MESPGWFRSGMTVKKPDAGQCAAVSVALVLFELRKPLPLSQGH